MARGRRRFGLGTERMLAGSRSFSSSLVKGIKVSRDRIISTFVRGGFGAGAVIRTLCARFGGWLLSQEHPGCHPKNLVLEERFELSRRYTTRVGELWRARGESNPRRGIDSAPSWPLEDAPKLGIPLRIRTGISSSVDSCPDPLDERDSGKDDGIRTRDLQIESLAA